MRVDADLWTDDRVAREFAPGRGLDLLLAEPNPWERKAVRQCRVLGQAQGDLALTPPLPPLPEPLLGQAVEITTLCDLEAGRKRRYAYRTSVLDVLEDYLGEAGPVPAVVVMFPRPGDIYATTLRKAKRFLPPPGGPLVLRGDGYDLTLLDISVKGLRMRSGADAPAFQPGQRVMLTLVVRDTPHQVRGRVMAVLPAPGGQEVSLELGIMPLDVWTSLLETLQELERGLDKQGSAA